MLFSETEKQIFSYPAPTGQTLHADPLQLRRRLLLASDGCLDEWLEEVKNKEELEAIADPHLFKREMVKQYELQEKFIKTTRKALGDVPEVDFETGVGFTDEWVLNTLQLFLSWISEKKA